MMRKPFYLFLLLFIFSILLPVSVLVNTPIVHAAASPQPSPTVSPMSSRPHISINPHKVDFGILPSGETGMKTIEISNRGSTDLLINDIRVTGQDADAFGQRNDCSTVKKGDGCTITVSFWPSNRAGKQTGLIEIASNDPKSPKSQVRLTGKTSPTKLSLSSSSLNFGKVNGVEVKKSITISNSGESPLTIDSVSLVGDSAFSLINTCGIIAEGASCTVMLSFKPVSAGLKESFLMVASDDQHRPVARVRLIGKCILPVTAPTFEPWEVLSSISFGDRIKAVAIADKKAFLAVKGVQIVDLSDPTDPQLVGSISPFESTMYGVDMIYHIAVTKNTVCLWLIRGCSGVCRGNLFDGTLRFYNITNPANPIHTASMDLGEGEILADGNYVYAALQSGWSFRTFYIIDVSDPAKPVIVGSVPFSYEMYEPGPYFVGKLSKCGDIVSITDLDDWGLLSTTEVNVADPTHPTFTGFTASWQGGTRGDRFYAPYMLFDDIAFIGDQSNLLSLVDMGFQPNPSVIQTLPVEDLSSSIKVYNNYLYVGYATQNAQVYSLQTAANPTFVKEIATETAGVDVYADEGIGIVVSEEVRQYEDYGYSILEQQKVNVFLTPTD